MWFTALIPLLSSLFGEKGPIGTYLKTKADKAQAAAELALQVEKDKLELSKAIAEAQVISEQNKLAATSQGFKTFSYILLTLPIVIVCFMPAVGKDIFNNLGLIPSWYAQLYVAVVGVIWGLPIASSAVSGIFGAVQQAWSERQNVKIDKIKALGEAKALNTEQAKKEIFDTMKKAVNLNGYTQAQVDIINPILDKVLSGQTTQPAAPTTVINN